MTLAVDIELDRGEFRLEAALSVAAGETLALLGPNGSGKSSMLAVIAGLLTPKRGTVSIDGRIVTETGSGSALRTAVAVPRRNISLLGQEPLLFPHLSALENVAFGPRSRGSSRRDARDRARHWLGSVGASEFEARMPRSLSGGQQQRVALARALATEPDVLLLDEPMAALDVQNASLIRTLLRDTIAERSLTTIVVTHDVVDAMVLADRVSILENGYIVDSGPVARVLGQPANRFAADLVGLNLIQSAGSPGTEGMGGEDCTAFPPSAVRLEKVSTAVVAPGELSWNTTVARLVPAVGGVRVSFDDIAIAAELSAAELLASGIQEGTLVTVSVDPAFVTAYRSPSVAADDGRM